MNAYLVLLVHSMDDLPVGLFATERAAVRFAESLKPKPTSAVRRMFQTDCSTPLCVKVVPFVKGRPRGFAIVKDFD